MKDKLRRCISCFRILNRDEMFRVMLKSSDGEVIVNPTSLDFGRSVYICKDKDCLEKAFKKGKIGKFLKAPVDESLKNILEREIN